MVASDPTMYRTYISYGKRGEALMYVRAQKSIYGCLKSALILYKKLPGDLESHGFEINPYSPCVTNKTVEVKQLTITWDMDYLKILHIDRKVVSSTIM